MFFPFVLFLSGSVLILFYNVHYLILLLGLELTLLGVLVYLFVGVLGEGGVVAAFVFFLVMVCVGGFSISVLVAVSRCWGRDYLYLGFLL